MGKVTGEEVIASPLPMKADVELTPGSYQLKQSVYGWHGPAWAGPGLALEKTTVFLCCTQQG